jgi:hypothetical protein
VQGLVGQYDRGVTGLDPAILPAAPVFIARLQSPTAIIVALVEIEANLLQLSNLPDPLGPPVDDDTGTYDADVYESDVYL